MTPTCVAAARSTIAATRVACRFRMLTYAPSGDPDDVRPANVQKEVRRSLLRQYETKPPPSTFRENVWGLSRSSVRPLGPLEKPGGPGQARVEILDDPPTHYRVNGLGADASENSRLVG